MVIFTTVDKNLTILLQQLFHYELLDNSVDHQPSGIIYRVRNEISGQNALSINRGRTEYASSRSFAGTDPAGTHCLHEAFKACRDIGAIPDPLNT
ncbi:hypothetical protein Zmor_002054 [Zophobas morio]|uniref:Uncharacterized protein n=1 Tax=Zophobas morio TaxID=2755281 RepID=A0AA38J5C3_9CUCU|nr:hypothetical protein Zmor_002054 [Zophobas morio]